MKLANIWSEEVYLEYGGTRTYSSAGTLAVRLAGKQAFIIWRIITNHSDRLDWGHRLALAGFAEHALTLTGFASPSFVAVINREWERQG